MGYRGEDVPAAQGDWDRQQPWQPSSGMVPGGAGDGYQAADGGSYGYGPDGSYPGQGQQSYPGQGQQGYGSQDGQYGDPYAQQPYGGYGPGQGQAGYGSPQGYSGDGYGYGYDQPQGYVGYDQPQGYDQPGYGAGDGYQAADGGYGPPANYPTSATDGYAPPYASGPYQATPGHSGGYPVGQADIDWYGGQPAAPTGSGSPSVAETRQQEQLDEFGPSADGGFQVTAARHGFNGHGGRDGYQDNLHADRGGRSFKDNFDGRRPRRVKRGVRRAETRSARTLLGGKRLLVAALSVVVVAVIGVAAYTFLFKPDSSSGDAVATGPLPTDSMPASQQACAKQLGTYCHIETATDDPKPLTVAELYKSAFTNEMDKTSYSLVSTKLDTTCSNAVIGQDLANALQAGKCTQVVRASYVSSNKTIMGTIGVVNLATTKDAQTAGHVVGPNDFIAPLTSTTGVASKLGNGTGLVEAEFKGHYLILTWSEYVNGTVPTTKAQDRQLERFSSDLVSGTANIALTQRMVTGAPATPGAASLGGYARAAGCPARLNPAAPASAGLPCISRDSRPVLDS